MSDRQIESVFKFMSESSISVFGHHFKQYLIDAAKLVKICKNRKDCSATFELMWCFTDRYSTGYYGMADNRMVCKCCVSSGNNADTTVALQRSGAGRRGNSVGSDDGLRARLFVGVIAFVCAHIPCMAIYRFNGDIGVYCSVATGQVSRS